MFKGRNTITYLDTMDEAFKKAHRIARQYNRICYVYETKDTHKFFVSRKTMEDFRIQLGPYRTIEHLPFTHEGQAIPPSHYEES